jgi:N-acylneuraminate cytidylyltransferase
LVKSKDGTYVRRQDCPHIYEYNGSMYYMWKNSLLNFGLHKMPKILKMIMPDERSIDIDNISDWNNAKQILNSKNN